MLFSLFPNVLPYKFKFKVFKFYNCYKPSPRYFILFTFYPRLLKDTSNFKYYKLYRYFKPSPKYFKFNSL